jgi:flavin-dependent dehydrogenase
MKILNDALVSDRYDVVVVGAGIGGLTAAALLGKRGLRTLVIENHYPATGVGECDVCSGSSWSWC